jgi:tetratricopeptide (TPR) repeat protein
MRLPIPSQPLQTYAARLADQQTSLLEEACRKVVDGRVEEALLLLDQAQALVWEPRVETLRKQLGAVRHPLPARAIERVRRAEEAARQGDIGQARMCLDTALERDPENPAVCRAAATVYEDMGCLEEAARCRTRSQDLEMERGVRKILEDGRSEIVASTEPGLVLDETAGPVDAGTGAPVYLVRVGGTMSHQDWAGQRGFWIRHDLVRVRKEG